MRYLVGAKKVCELDEIVGPAKPRQPRVGKLNSIRPTFRAVRNALVAAAIDAAWPALQSDNAAPDAQRTQTLAG